MAVLAIVTSSPPGVEGGHLVIARALVEAGRARGHDARLVITPDYGFGRSARTYWETWRTDIHQAAGARVDQVISLRYPSYAIRHPAHVCWLNHTMREYYDLWPRLTAGISRKNLLKERIRRTLTHAADAHLLKDHVTRLLAQSKTIQRRLIDELGIRAEVLHPPAPQRPYRCEEYGDYIFAMSRLTPLKRVDLLIRALAEPAARGVRAVIAGDGEERASLDRLAHDLGVADRVTFLGRVDDDVILEHLARCRAVSFTPLGEDYGFVTVEAFASRKAVITCHDSGGPTELVRDGESGLVCDPTAPAVASALGRIMDDRTPAERMGAAGALRAARMTWDAALDQLVIV